MSFFFRIFVFDFYDAFVGYLFEKYSFMQKDRFRGYREDVESLVVGFETMLAEGERRFFDVGELEIVIDYYIDSHNLEMLDQSVAYAESLFPQSSTIRLRRTHQLCAHERFDEALAMLNDLEHLEPDNTDVLYTLGTVYSAIGQPRKAIQYYRRAATDGFQLGVVYGNIADEYVNLGQESEAVAYYHRALALAPDDETIIEGLAGCYVAANEMDKSVEYFTDFVEKNPYSRAGWYYLGASLMEENLYEKAIDAFEYSLAIDEKYALAYISMAEAYRELAQFSKAVQALQDSLPYIDDKAAIYYNIGTIYFERNIFPSAEVYYKYAINEDPYFADALMAMARCCAEMNDYSSAVDYATRAIKINPHSAEFVVNLAKIHDRFGYPDEAEPLFECGVNMEGCDGVFWLDYVDFMVLKGRYAEGFDIIQRALPKVDDEMVPYFNIRLVACCFKLGHRSLLFNAIQACMRENPDDIKSLLKVYPEMAQDAEILSIITSFNE